MTLNILIIDDKEQKIDDLRRVITSISDDIDVEEAQTIVDARAAQAVLIISPRFTRTLTSSVRFR